MAASNRVVGEGGSSARTTGATPRLVSKMHTTLPLIRNVRFQRHSRDMQSGACGICMKNPLNAYRINTRRCVYLGIYIALTRLIIRWKWRCGPRLPVFRIKYPRKSDRVHSPAAIERFRLLTAACSPRGSSYHPGRPHLPCRRNLQQLDRTNQRAGVHTGAQIRPAGIGQNGGQADLPRPVLA